MRIIRTPLPVLLLIALAVPVAAQRRPQPPPGTVGNDVCAGCHEQEKKLTASVHAKVPCSGCHAKHEEFPHPENLPKPKCAQCHALESEHYENSVHGQEASQGNGAAPACANCHNDVHETVTTKSADVRKGIPETCGMCHDKAYTQFEGGVHGKAVTRGILDAPVCTDCHGDHQILRTHDTGSTVFADAVPDTCGRCHGDLRLMRRFGLPADRLTSFKSSFHGLALKSGLQTVAGCTSCHGYHGILPSSDPKSMVHPSNLAKTCGACHPGAGDRFALGPIHEAEQGEGAPAPIRYAQWFYALVIPATIGLMALHHGGDFIRKLAHLRFSAGAATMTVVRRAQMSFRMYTLERIQHALLAVSFIVLAWTGFALHYPDAWWAKPLLAWESNWPVRGTVHRVAAVVMLGVTVMHMLTLIMSRRLRDHWLHLLPRVSDVREATQGMLYRLGLRKDQPYVSPHSYVEKAEYWAVVWGTAVMAVTGIFLWANRLTLEYFPKWFIDFSRTVHFLEAVLATLAIVVWHFYSVMFDPDVYPLDTAWLTGKSPRHQPGEHEAEGHAPSRPDKLE